MFAELKEVSQIIKEVWPGMLVLGRADFKSAYKTLPPQEDQRWMCWSLVFDPCFSTRKVVPLFFQAFGSLGAVVAWYRTATAVQHIMTHLFGLPIMVYVDDCFWLAPKFEGPGKPTSAWIQCVFEYVVQFLLGWALEPR